MSARKSDQRRWGWWAERHGEEARRAVRREIATSAASAGPVRGLRPIASALPARFPLLSIAAPSEGRLQATPLRIEQHTESKESANATSAPACVACVVPLVFRFIAPAHPLCFPPTDLHLDVLDLLEDTHDDGWDEGEPQARDRGG